MEEKQIKAYKDSKKLTKINSFFGYYYMPFSLSEILLLIPYFFLVILLFYSLLKTNSNYYLKIIIFILQFFLLLYFLVKKFYLKITTNLSQKNNIYLVANKLEKERFKFYKNQYNDVFIIENKIGYFKGTEYIIIVCRDNNVFINSFFTRTLISNSSIIMKNLISYFKIIGEKYPKKHNEIEKL